MIGPPADLILTRRTKQLSGQANPLSNQLANHLAIGLASHLAIAY